MNALCEAALAAMKLAYAPYSGFKVGAALLGESGRIYTGCNIENAAYTPTVCAERVALFKAVSEGERAFRALAVTGGKGGNADTFFMPCGVCRQAFREFCGDSFPVTVVKSDGTFAEYTLGELLPHSFSPDSLNNNQRGVNL